MTTEKAPGSFTKLPNKIFELGLDAYEIAAFAALASHGGDNAQGIFPSWPRLMQLTGMSRKRLWVSLDVLHRCNVILWDRGKTGVANTYLILGVGAWSRKRVDKSGGPCGQVGGGSFPQKLPVVPQGDSGSFPQKLPVVPQGNSNQTQLNQTQITTGAAFNFGDNSGWDEDRIQREKARQIAALARLVGKSAS